jgi:O-antigen/teichoic acid export membrane protein
MQEAVIDHSPGGDLRQPRRIAVNSGYLLIAYVAESLLSILLLSLVARYLDQAGFGRYGYVVSFIELFIMLTELSNSRVLVREVASDPAHGRQHLADIWTMRLGLSLIMIAAVLVAERGHAGDPQLWWAILLFAVGQVFYVLTEVFNAVFRAYQQMRYQTITIVSGQVMIVLFCLVAIGLDWGLVGLFAARAAANLLRLLLGWYLSRTRFIPERLSGNWPSMWYLLRESFPLGVNLTLRRLVWRGGIVLLTTLLNQQSPGQGDLAAGLLYGPLRLVEQMRIVPVSLVGAILPVFSQQARQEPTKFRDYLAKSFKLFLALSLLLAVTMTGLAGPITRLVLGSGLAAAAAVLAVFGWVVLFTFPNQFFEAALLAVGRQSVVAVGLGFGFVVGALTSWLYLIPVHQALGVAYGVMLAEGIAFIVSLVVLLPYFNRRELAVSMGKIALACLVAGGTFYGLRGLSIWLVGPLGLLVFLVATLLLRTFDVKELEAILAMVTFHRRLRWIRRRLFGALAASAPTTKSDQTS